ncbi:GtrA family protein [Marinobacter sp. AN1]|uniref:GtrA family protein n=1 Tax=Marinobacter sp. AN1 TaxID=2886046 RepID=UPI00222F04DE|nr:GtrA family protein [Marinobacter sp. AN1]UZD67305.1 GtrA family protein [Marinobacter sp. AN1]
MTKHCIRHRNSQIEPLSYIHCFDIFLMKRRQSHDTGLANLSIHQVGPELPVVIVAVSLMSKLLTVQLQGFIAAGGLATLFHWFVMAALTGAGVDAMLATASGSLSGAVMNYGLQRRLAFRNAGPHRLTAWRYLVSCICAWLCNLAFFYLLHHILTLPVTLSQLVTTGLVAALNYIVYKRLVFYEQIP